MIIICVASQKGGSTKTTMTAHLAVEAERVGDGPVVMLDADPQASLSEWWSAREAETPALGKFDLKELDTLLPLLRSGGWKYCFIDTPPYALDSIREIIRRSDLVIVPTRPSPLDVRAIGATVQIAEQAGKPTIFVVAGAAHRARITVEVVTELSQHGPVAPQVINQRTDYAAAMTDGHTAPELDPSGRSAMEIGNLWHFIKVKSTKSPASKVAHHDTIIRKRTTTSKVGIINE